MNNPNFLFVCFKKHYVWEVGVEGGGLLQDRGPSLCACMYCSSLF